MFDQIDFKKINLKLIFSTEKLLQGLLNDLKIKDENQRFKVLRAIDKYDRIDENFKDLLQKERIDPISGDKITGANLSNDQAKLIIKFLKLKDLKDLKLE